MGRYDIDLGLVTNETHASGLVAVDAAFSGTEVAVAEVRVGQAAFLCRVTRTEELVPRYVVVEQEWRGEVQVTVARRTNETSWWSSSRQQLAQHSGCVICRGLTLGEMAVRWNRRR